VIQKKAIGKRQRKKNRFNSRQGLENSIHPDEWNEDDAARNPRSISFALFQYILWVEASGEAIY
jgi:hypothetical protein